MYHFILYFFYTVECVLGVASVRCSLFVLTLVMLFFMLVVGGAVVVLWGDSSKEGDYSMEGLAAFG